MGSRRQKKAKKAIGSVRNTVNPKFIVVIFIIISIGVLSLGWHFYFKEKKDAVLESAIAKSHKKASFKTESTASTIDMEPLLGRWVRLDGGYIIEIRSIGSNGQMDAAYFNPRPIHVAKAVATQSGSSLKVFLELRDVGYPGSTYTLIHKPQKDLLLGIYYHAGTRQRFNVVFARQR
jgi:hypothetical protein